MSINLRSHQNLLMEEGLDNPEPQIQPVDPGTLLYGTQRAYRNNFFVLLKTISQSDIVTNTLASSNRVTQETWPLVERWKYTMSKDLLKLNKNVFQMFCGVNYDMLKIFTRFLPPPPVKKT